MRNVVDDKRLTLLKTPDGSYTFHDEVLQESYHSVHGAKTESEYVYLDQGLSMINKDRIRVLEMGFGTGLNAFLTWQFALHHQKSIYYRTIEKNPIPPQLLPIPDFVVGNKDEEQLWNSLHAAIWERELCLDSCFTIWKTETDLGAFLTSDRFDIVFFDAFAPSIQPELWTLDVFEKIFILLNPGGMLVTYSSAGTVKRAIQSAGFDLERLPGPPGKKHMLRAFKPVG